MNKLRKPVARSTKGAVLAEFIIAIIPISAMFLCVCQIARLQIARLATMHAAQVSVRACAVIVDPDPGHDQGVDGKDTDVVTAERQVLKPFEGSEYAAEDATCKHSGDVNGGTDTVTIKATYTCTIPLARHIICPGGTRKLDAQAQFPHQGAEYEL